MIGPLTTSPHLQLLSKSHLINITKDTLIIQKISSVLESLYQEQNTMIAGYNCYSHLYLKHLD